MQWAAGCDPIVVMSAAHLSNGLVPCLGNHMTFHPDDLWVDEVNGLRHVSRIYRRRLYRIGLVWAIGVSYLIDAILLFLFSTQGTVSINAALAYAAAGSAHVALFSLLHWTGFTERFANPHLTTWQMAFGVGVQLLGITLAPQITSFFLGIMFIVFALGSLRISLREALTLWFFSGLAIATTIAFNRDIQITVTDPNRIELMLIAISFSLILLRTILVGFYGSALRQKMYARNANLESEATHDPLTGILNRRALLSTIEEHISLCQRKDIPACLAMIDIDRFKPVNDTHGHMAGDLILKSLVTFLLSKIRDSDKLVRYGGEEFVLLLAATSLPEALPQAERICHEIAHSTWPEVTADIRITISIGLTEIQADDQPLDAIARADTALYTAKRNGRNRVVHVPLPSQ